MPEPHEELPPTKTQSGPPEAPASAVGGDTLPAIGKSADAGASLFQPSGHAGDLGRLGRYRVLKGLGVGGMGAVFLAFDEGLQRRAALKVMLPQFAAVPAARERFVREARACARVKSEHVVTIYDVGEDDDMPFIAMEYLQGYALDEYLKRHDNLLSVPQVLRVGREVGEGLAAAHAHGLIHRDIKPGNIWLEAPKGRVKILDFGLAKPVDPEEGGDDGQLTKTGAVIGTPAYMSPEQARGEKKLDARSDLFSLGTVLYRLTTGRLPFNGVSATALLLSLGMDTPPSVQMLNPAVPDALADLIHRLLAKDVAHRPASASEVAAELLRIERGLAAGVLSSGDPVPMATALAAEPQVIYVPIHVTAQPSEYDPAAFAGLDDPSTAASGVDPEDPARPRRGGWVAWAVAVAAVLLVGVLGAVVWRKLNPPKPVPQPVEPPAAGVVPPVPPPGQTPPAVVSDPTFFNGKDLTGWEHDPRHWRVENGELVGDKTVSNASYITTQRRYSDFELSFALRVTRGQQNGPPTIFFRVPHTTPTDFRGPHLIMSPRDGTTLQNTKGSGAGQFVRFYPTVGEEYRVLIRCVGSRVTIVINDQVVCTDKPFDLPADGVIGFMMAGGSYAVVVRDIRFKDLSPSDRPFFNGKDLTGWGYERKTEAKWEVGPGGELIGSRIGGVAIRNVPFRLYTERFYRDFELSFGVLARPIPGPSPSGAEVLSAAVWFRAEPGPPGTGWVGPRCNLGPNSLGRLIERDADAGRPRGETAPPAAEGEFHRATVRCVGKTVTIIVNGKVTFDGPCDIPAEGRIAWYFGPAVEGVTFRDIRFTDLSNPPDPAFFNGKDFTGWKDDSAGKVWSVQNGEIVGTNFVLRRPLWFDRPAGDFRITFEARVKLHDRKDTAHGAEFRFGSGGEGTASAVVKVNDASDLLGRSDGGTWESLVKRPAEVRAAMQARPDDYHAHEITRAGKRVTIRVAGVPAFDGEVPNLPDGDRLLFSAQPNCAEIRVRNLRFADLNNPAGKSGP